MGYDEYECLSCYCGDGGGGNNPTSKKAWTCMKCIDRITEEYQDCSRVISAIKYWTQNESRHGDCERCGRTKKLVLNVTTCKYHPRVDPVNDSVSSESFESSESS